MIPRLLDIPYRSLKIAIGFQKWIDAYADMGRHSASADELWELRNSLLHMTNLDSRKVRSGQVSRIIIYIDSITKNERTCTDKSIKFLNLKQFIDTVAQAISKWVQSYNDNPTKLVHFVKRYDLTVSDMRMAFHDKTS